MTIETVLIKTEFEERFFDFDFTDDLDDGETIQSSPEPVISATPEGLTIDPPTISGGRVQAKFKAGTAPTTYHVTCQGVTSTQKREVCGDLEVLDC